MAATFTDADRETSLPVAIVNEKMAHDYWPAGALGKRIQLPGEKVMRQVVGVARTANYTAWGEPPQPCAYVPLAQNDSETMVLYVRSKGDPRELLAPVERELRAVGPQVLVFGTRTGSEVIDGGLFQARMGVGLLTTFGLLALGLASIGLYGVLAYSVNRRKREIGLRMALGATRASVLRMILSEGMSLVMTGVMIGFVAALAVGRLLSRMLFGIGGERSVERRGGCAHPVGGRAAGLLSAGAMGNAGGSPGSAARGLTVDPAKSTYLPLPAFSKTLRAR